MHGPMNNSSDIRRKRRESRLPTAKPISIKGAKRKSGGYGQKVVRLTSGGLRRVSYTETGGNREVSRIASQKSAEGVVGWAVDA